MFKLKVTILKEDGTIAKEEVLENVKGTLIDDFTSTVTQRNFRTIRVKLEQEDPKSISIPAGNKAIMEVL